MGNDNAVGLFHLLYGAGKVVRIVNSVTLASSHDVDQVVVGKLRIKRNRNISTRHKRIEAGDPVIAVFA